MDLQPLEQHTLNVLEWPRVLEILAGYTRSAMGAELCRAMPLETELDAAQRRSEETAEMTALQEDRDAAPSFQIPDPREAIRRVAKGAVLEPHDLRDLSVILGVARDVFRYFDRHRREAPRLAAVAEPLEGLHAVSSLKEAIDRCVDEEGHIRESATPELRRLMHQANDLKQTMRRRLDTILGSRRYAEVIQEQYFAQRQGRYVIPVKAEMRSKIPGIVHDVSASGATVFVEPRELVELNNSIKVAELEVDREVQRILQDLSARIASHVPAFRDGLEVLARLDAISAKAAFGRAVGGTTVPLNVTGRIALRRARHPLLTLSMKERVVPNDVMMDESVRVLVISGPNTGGKTVTLKILGLFSLMARCGVPLPCDAPSEMALFPDVYADIGDAQDLAKSLSSFSAHMTQMIQLLAEASGAPGDAAGAGALVLLDEPVTSTDPAEGAALAQALLLRLAGLGLKVAVTTHYNSLKVLAQTTPGFLNASVGFDVRTLSPTYRVIMGVPGGSSAIDIAGRLGMDETILDEALRLLKREDRTLERVLSDLQEKQRRLDEELAAVQALKAEAERSASEAAAAAERLRVSEQEQRGRAKKKLTDEVLQARASIQSILDELKADKTVFKAKQAKQRLAEIEEQARRSLIPPQETIPLERLQSGDSVEIVSLGTAGTLLESPQGKRRVRVRVGDADLSVSSSLLVGRPESTDTKRSPSRRPWPSMRASSASSLAETEAAFVDVRGKTADEALDLTVSALDRASLAGSPFLRIIHGHGTGKLRASLRSYLTESPYVASFRPGERPEGGDGVTIVELR